MSETTKTVYRYNKLTKQYTGILVLNNTDKDPKGNWNIPANCTETAPTITSGMVNTWNGSAWVQSAEITDMLCYYNNGLSYKTEKSNYTVQSGEVLFSTTPTTAQLTAAFSGYAAAALAAAKVTAEAPIKALLSDTDYETIKYAEGEITATQYSALKSARAAWRTAIRSIEAATTVDAVSAVTYSTDIPSVS